MADIAINTNDRRTQSTASSSQTVFTTDWPITDEDEIIVEQELASDGSVSTLTKTTHYAVTNVGVEAGFTVTLVSGAASGDKITISGNTEISRPNDFTSSGPVLPSILNPDLDRLTMMMQEQQTALDRSLQLPRSDPDQASALALPVKSDRLGTVLAFHATTGLPVAGPTIAATGTVAEIAADIATLADIDADITTVAGVSANVATVAGIASAVTAVAADATDIGVVATDLAGSDTIGTVAGLATEVAALGALASQIAALDGISANITTVAGISTDVSAVAAIDSDVTAVAAIDSAVTTVAADGTDIGTVAGISSDVTTVAGIAASVSLVAADGTDIGAVAAISSDVSTVAGDTVAIGALAALTTEIGALGAITTDITAVAAVDTDVTAVAAVASDVTAVAAIAADVSTVAADGTDIGAVAAISSDVTDVAAIDSDVTAVAAIDSDVTTVANNISAVNAAVKAAARAGFRQRFGVGVSFVADFALGEVSQIALTRATVGFTNTDGGEVESKAIDAVRLAHDASTGEPLGLLVEPAATNHHITSNSLGGNGVVRMTVTDDDAVAPDGTTTAGTMTETATTGSHAAGASAGKFTIASAGAFYCLSAYVKDVGANSTQHSSLIYTGPFSGPIANWHGWQWDFATETLTPYQPANENVTVGYEKFANGWYRLWATRAPTGASGSGGVGFSFQNDGSSYLGDTDNSMAMWGLMLEEVESLDAGPSSVILTDGSEVTRSADLATADLSAISAFRADGFSLLVEATILDGDGVLLAVGKTSTNEIALVMDAGDLTLTGADSLDLTAASGLTPGDRIVVALRVAANDVAISVDGATVVTDGTHSLNADADEMQFGANIDGSSGLPCIIQQVAVFGPLPDATLEAMSNG